MAQDFRYTDGDRIGMTVDGGGTEGQAVKVTGDMTVSVVGTDGGDHDGILTVDADDGDKVVIALSGAIEADVADGVAAGDYLAPNADGALRAVDTAGGEATGPRTTLALTSAADGKAYVRLP